MSDTSPRLNLPYLLQSQAQKHVTHNEALERLDALVQMAVLGFYSVAPPALPQEGDIYVLGGSPSGDWTGQEGKIAVFSGGGWLFLDARDGSRAWDLTLDRLMVFKNGTWTAVMPNLTNVAGVGIQSGWDTVNRLSVSSTASLFNNAGAGHQIKVNKANTTDTASLLFQSGFVGHAEMGLSGTNAFSVKVSANGSAWQTALNLDPVASELSTPFKITGLAVQQSQTDTTAGRLMRADWGYGRGTILGSVTQSGGVPTGAVIERGQNSNGHYTRWADGTQICWRPNFVVTAAAATTLEEWWTFPAAFSAAPSVSFYLSLVAADWVGIGRQQVSCWGAITAPSTTTVKMAVYPAAGTGSVTGTISNNATMAFGRWF